MLYYSSRHVYLQYDESVYAIWAVGGFIDCLVPLLFKDMPQMATACKALLIYSLSSWHRRIETSIQRMLNLTPSPNQCSHGNMCHIKKCAESSAILHTGTSYLGPRTSC